MEWLVTDQKGLFAFGTPSGVRSRKYHSFLSGIAGRLETNFLADFDIACQDRSLLTHAYNSNQGVVYYPQSNPLLKSFKSDPWPNWTFEFDNGQLLMQFNAIESGGFSLSFAWNSKVEQQSTLLKLKPLWAMRPLHGLGAHCCEARKEGSSVVFGSLETRSHVILSCDNPFDWRPESLWYKDFYYAIEKDRGYDAIESLYSAGWFEITLEDEQTSHFDITLESNKAMPRPQTRRLTSKLNDFILQEPAGVIAGLPWFGEWGRDTFIALPGIVANLFDTHSMNNSDKKIIEWTIECLERWGRFLLSDGMLPNVLTPEGPQWESCDATLWWTHSLAALWTFSVARPRLGLHKILEQRFLNHLSHAIETIKSERHRFLKPSEHGLLSVTSGHTTWMDARVNSEASTPRTGLLPEINSLWVQAQGLRALWSLDLDQAQSNTPSLAEVATHALELAQEKERPNTVFFHSLPLAPTFLFPNLKAMQRDAKLLEALITPLGLRTLNPTSSQYSPHYLGNQPERDRIYHQGPVWGWLGGHYLMAAARLKSAGVKVSDLKNDSYEMPPESFSSIPGHYAELFDAEQPWVPRGAPAQAWSLACATEARLRVAWRVDEAVSRLWRHAEIHL